MKDIIDIIKKKSDIENFNCIKIGLVSPEQILARSYGEIKKAETINYRTFKPERDGLFCAKIFGPIKDYECLCGKYKKLKHRGIICEKCGVEVTATNVRRSRMANITLATPIAHIWFLKSLPSKIGLLLDLTLKDVEKILYFEQYVVVDPGVSSLKKNQLLTENECSNAIIQYGDEVTIHIGAEAIQMLLKNLDIKEEIKNTKERIKITNSDIKIKKLSKRLKILESFTNPEHNPEWMILNVLPVLPPDLRPLVPLDGGRFASSDLNDLYRRVINRNNRLKKLIDLSAPNIIIKNEKRMLQEAIDALIDNGRRGKTVNGSNKRPLKSLADMIKGKQGRFRQNLLGKRVDYSGRSVIVVGPKLKLHQCGIPKKMAIELFKPFIFAELKKRNITTTIKSSKKLVEEEGENIWDILNEIVYEHPVLLNRAPTLHRLGIQAFEPILIDGKAIQLHPLVCTAFNADFDGDQMAIHIPLTLEAQLEAKILMLSTNNILSPANGEPTIVPSQDIVLGIYYLSKEKNNNNIKIKFFKNSNDVEKAFENSKIELHEKINLKIKNSFIKTTCGRALLSKILPENLDFNLINKLMTKKEISNLISACYKINGVKETVTLADRLMNIGFEYATKSGISIGIEDIHIPKEKTEIIKNTEEIITNIDNAYANGLINKEDRYNQIIDVWSKANDSITKALMKNLASKEITNEDGKKIVEDSFNPIYMMAESGARGSITQIRQLAGMRGLMAKPDGSIIETPITANFREGLNILQYFISTHGARKGLADTALKTANSGYLTRRLVDVAQDLVITKNDCETNEGIIVTEIIDDGNIIEKLTDRIKGRVIQENIFDKNGNIIIKIGTLLSDYHIEILEQLNIKKINVRSVITCKLRYGICSKCYGTDLTTNKMISIGEAVGVIAAQSIGEPGTQLTMRTFHIGGAASRTTLINSIQSKTTGIIEYKNIKTIIQADTKNIISVSRSGRIIITDNYKKELEQYKIPYGAIIHKANHAVITKNEMLATWDPHNIPIISEINGTIKYTNLIEGITLKKELDEATGLSNLIVFDSNKSEQNLNNVKPNIEIINNDTTIDTNEKNITNYFLSPGTIINVENNQKIKIGDIIAKIPKEISKIKDITGGLPRVADIFEARKPKNSAILADISGTIFFGKETKDKNRILIKDDNENFHEFLIPKWQNVNVFEHETVLKGDMIVEGEQNLHDILKLLGVNELADQIKKAVQEVYRLQGVKIDDKHIEVIIKQMLKKATIVDPGDSELIKDDQENVAIIEKINDNLRSENKKEIIYKPILLGITKAALTTESFISAASFQETTKVLTDAAVNYKKDKLLGLKENVIVGKLIPAGTGFYQKLNQL